MAQNRAYLSPSPRRGFTLVELLALLVIMAVAVVLVLVAMGRSRTDSRKACCRFNLVQFHKALVLFDQNHDAQREDYPLRLTYLLTGSASIGAKFVQEDKLFQCPADQSCGKEGGKPASAKKQYTELDEGPGMGADGDPPCAANAPLCSYLYEFSGAECSWWNSGMLKGDDRFTALDTGGNQDRTSDGKVSWQEAKFYQLERSDAYMENGYPRTWFPILRCCWHAKSPDTADKSDDQEILNLAIDGNFFVSGSDWETTAKEHSAEK
jgi:hypothetical protein